MAKLKHSIYPTSPPGSQVLVKIPANELTSFDQLVVLTSSLFFVGSVFWVPALYVWALKRFRSIPKEQKKRRALYVTILLSMTAFFVAGPHRHARVSEWVNVHKWSLWKSWLRFFAFEVVADQGYESLNNLLQEQAIVAISPHGIFPFGLAFAALSGTSERAFGKFRAVVASATQMIPWVRDVLLWVRAVYVKNIYAWMRWPRFIILLRKTNHSSPLAFCTTHTFIEMPLDPQWIKRCQKDLASDLHLEVLPKCLKDIPSTSLTRMTSIQ
jgi:hypothetical protein